MAIEHRNAVIERLINHYQNNVLEPEPNPKFEEIRKLLENPETFEEVVAEGLNRKSENLEIIRKPDVEGSTLIKFDSGLSMAEIKISHNTFMSLREKMAMGKNTEAITYFRKAFDENSFFYGINVVLLDDGCFSENLTLSHEESHVRYNEFSRPRKTIARTKNRASASDDKKELIKLSYMLQETRVLKEISALSTELKINKWPSDSVSRYSNYYAERYAKSIAASLDDAGLLQNYWGRNIPKQKAKEMVRKEAKKYFERKFEAGIEAIKILYENLPEDMFERIVRSCGPNEKEIQSKNYVGPVKELTDWVENENYKEVLSSVGVLRQNG